MKPLRIAVLAVTMIVATAVPAGATPALTSHPGVIHDRVFATTSSGKPLPSTGRQFYPAYMHDFAVKEDNGITPAKAAPPLPAVPAQPETDFVQDCLSTHLTDAQRSAGWTKNHYRWCLTGALHWQKYVVDSNGNEQVVAELVMAVTWSGYADPFARRFVIWAITGGIQFIQGESLFHDGDLFALAAQCSPGDSASCTAQTTPADMRTLAEIRDNPAVTVQTVLTDTSLNNYPLTGDKVASFNIIATWEAHDATGNGGASWHSDPVASRCDSSQLRTSQACIFNNVAPFLVYDRADQTYPVTAVADNIRYAQDTLGAPGKFAGTAPVGPALTRLRDGDKKRNNYKISYNTCRSSNPPWDWRIQQCDEYPFQSTYQGAASGGPSIASLVPAKQNREAGIQLKNYYDWDRILDGDAFWVEVIN